MFTLATVFIDVLLSYSHVLSIIIHSLHSLITVYVIPSFVTTSVYLLISQILFSQETLVFYFHCLLFGDVYPHLLTVWHLPVLVCLPCSFPTILHLLYYCLFPISLVLHNPIKWHMCLLLLACGVVFFLLSLCR